MPSDPTDTEDMIHTTLLKGECDKTLSYASQIDPWLAAHLADIMVPLDLIESSPNEE
jgi:nuclear pore complex protein Nup85